MVMFGDVRRAAGCQSKYTVVSGAGADPGNLQGNLIPNRGPHVCGAHTYPHFLNPGFRPLSSGPLFSVKSNKGLFGPSNLPDSPLGPPRGPRARDKAALSYGSRRDLWRLPAAPVPAFTRDASARRRRRPPSSASVLSNIQRCRCQSPSFFGTFP